MWLEHPTSARELLSRSHDEGRRSGGNRILSETVSTIDYPIVLTREDGDAASAYVAGLPAYAAADIVGAASSAGSAPRLRGELRRRRRVRCGAPAPQLFRNRLPSNVPENSPIGPLWRPSKMTVNVPVAPANRPVPPVIVATGKVGVGMNFTCCRSGERVARQ
jgi:hypothetical protein